MAHQISYILAMFRKPSAGEAVKSFGFMGLAALCQLPVLYLAIKNGSTLQGMLSAIAIVCFTIQSVLSYVRYSRLASGGPALWIDNDYIVIAIDRTVRVHIADIHDYKFIVAPKTRKPFELKLETRNGKTQSLPLYDLDGIEPLITFLRRIVPGRAYPAN
jgi:hypothetical protein